MAKEEETEKEDKPWYETFFSWFGSTAKDVYTATLQSQTAKYEADAIRAANEAQNNQKLTFFGKELSKETILWIFGGSLIAVLLVSMVRRR